MIPTSAKVEEMWTRVGEEKPRFLGAEAPRNDTNEEVLRRGASRHRLKPVVYQPRPSEHVPTEFFSNL
jgi:hypothetical protein